MRKSMSIKAPENCLQSFSDLELHKMLTQLELNEIDIKMRKEIIQTEMNYRSACIEAKEIK